MSGATKKRILHTLSVKLAGCGGCCRSPKLSAVYSPRPKHTHYPHHHYTSSSSTATATTFSSAVGTPPQPSDTDSDTIRAVPGFGRIGGESVAVEKDSDDPYQDFRRSMLQMIMENEIYSRDDLKELLNCFLQLNSPYYHGVIIRAFTEIWNGVNSNIGV